MEESYKRVEGLFQLFARLVYRRPLTMLTLVFAATAAMTSQLPKLTLDVSNESMFHETSPLLLNYHAFKEQFGREDLIIISVEPKKVFEEQFLQKLRAFHRELEASVPHLDEVTSLLNARNTRGEGDELIVEDLFENWPQNAAELAAIEQRAMANPIYRNLLLSADGAVTAVVVRPSPYAVDDEDQDVLEGFDESSPGDAETRGQKPFLDDAQNAEFVTATRAIVEKYHSDDFPLALSGVPVITDTLKAVLRQDFGRFIIGSLLVTIVLLLLMFRRASGVLMPLATIILTLLTTLGLMAVTGIAFKVQTQILPSFLMAVGVGAAVHVLSMFYKRYDESGDKEQALVDAMGHTGLPVLGACITTAVGLLSFINTSLAPLAELGIFASAGIMLSLLYTLIMIPAFLALLPVKQKPVAVANRGAMDRMLTLTAEFSIRNSKPIIIACAMGTLVAVWGVFQLRFYHNVLEWFPEETPVRLDTARIDTQFNGVRTVEVVVDTGVENGLYQPALLNALDQLEGKLAQIRYKNIVSGKTLSIADIVKEINRALNEDRPEFYKIPQNRNLVAQELLLFENSGTDDLEDYVDSQFSKARYTIKIPWSDASSTDHYLDRLRSVFRDNLPEDVDFYFTGIATLYSHIAMESMASMKQAYLLAVVVISGLMVLFIGNLKIGLIAMIPNLSPILMTLGVMGMLDLPMAVITMFIGSIALGLAVDDTLHFLHGFRRFHHKTGDTEQAILLTFQSTGRAMVVTTAALSMGFFVFMFATMENQFLFGLLTGMTIILALLADFILVPAILKELVKDTPRAEENVVAEIA
jgi:predicted RND superfamily exporter protein